MFLVKMCEKSVKYLHIFGVIACMIANVEKSVLFCMIILCIWNEWYVKKVFYHEMNIYWYRTCTKFYPYKASLGLFVL